MPRTEVAVTPAVSAHMAVVGTEAKKFTALAFTALKYLGGRAMVILPPMGMVVAVWKPRVMAPVLNAPGTLSPGAANTMEAPLAS